MCTWRPTCLRTRPPAGGARTSQTCLWWTRTCTSTRTRRRSLSTPIPLGNKLIPPRYYDAEAYRQTIHRIRALESELLLTAHYPPMARAEARAFCDCSLGYVDEVERVAREGRAAGETRLRQLTERVDARVGPFPEFATEIAAGVRSHLAALA
jgi:hypothetical protein